MHSLLEFPLHQIKLLNLGKTSKKTAYFMTSGKKVGGPRTKTKFQKKILSRQKRHMGLRWDRLLGV